MFCTLVYFQVLNFIYDILFTLLTIFIWLYRFVYIVQPCDNMSHTVAFCITIYRDCWGCSMLTLVWVSKRAQDMFNNSRLLQQMWHCHNDCQQFVIPVSSFDSKEATWFNLVQKPYVENNIITYYFVNIFYFPHLIFSERSERLIFESEHSQNFLFFILFLIRAIRCLEVNKSDITLKIKHRG